MAEQLQQHTNKFTVTVNGVAMPAELEDLLVAVVVDDSLHLPDLFTLTFRDPLRAVLTTAKIEIGAIVEIKVVSESAPAGEQLIKGEVTALEAEYEGTGTYTVVRGFDHSHRLFHGRTTETYTNVTYSDVVKEVAKRHELQTGQIDPSTPTHEHVSQANVCDWQFLQGLAKDIGYEVAVVEGKLEFRVPTDSKEGPGRADLTSMDPLQLVYGSNLLRFHATVTAAEQVNEVEVRGWDVTQKKAVMGIAPAETTSAELPVKPVELAKKFGGAKYVGVDVPYGTQVEVDRAVKAVAEELSSAFAELEGVARGNPKLRAGTAVSLSLVGAPFEGKYRLTATRHVYDPHTGYTTTFAASGRQERSLLGLASGNGGGTQQTRPPVYGVVSAQVTDVNDPDDLGRVKLRFPWLSDTYVSDWARTVHAGAGPKRGAVILPEVNDEVLVAFEQGDVRRPYVIGGLYNGVDRPELGPSLIDGSRGAVKRRGFVSKTGGALIFFDDDADEGVALMTGDRGFRIALDKTKTTIHVSSSGKVEIEGSQDVTIRSGMNLTVEAGAQLVLKGQTVAVKGTTIQLN